MKDRGYWAKHQDGQRYWHAAPERDSCGGTGYISCFCGGDFCCCGNQGEIECQGCDACDGDEDRDPVEDFDELDENDPRSGRWIP